MAIFLILLGALIIFLASVVFSVLAFYFVIKKAVRNGILESYDIIHHKYM